MWRPWRQLLRQWPLRRAATATPVGGNFIVYFSFSTLRVSTNVYALGGSSFHLTLFISSHILGKLGASHWLEPLIDVTSAKGNPVWIDLVI